MDDNDGRPTTEPCHPTSSPRAFGSGEPKKLFFLVFFFFGGGGGGGRGEGGAVWMDSEQAQNQLAPSTSSKLGE